MRMRKIVALMVVSLIAVIGLGAAASDDKDEAVKKDLEALAGTWGTLSFVNDGKKLNDEEAKTHTVIYDKDGKYQALNDGKVVFAGTFKIDPAKKPKTINVTESGKDKDKAEVFLGIYEIDSGKLKVCFAPPGKEQPTEFSSKPGSGRLFSVRQWQKK